MSSPPGKTYPALFAIGTRGEVRGGVLGDAVPYYSLAIWHGLNVPLMMSLFGLAAGIALYFGIRKLIDLYGISYDSLGRRVFEWKFERATGWAAKLTATLENGSLQRYLGLMVLSALVMGATRISVEPAVMAARSCSSRPQVGNQKLVCLPRNDHSQRRKDHRSAAPCAFRVIASPRSNRSRNSDSSRRRSGSQSVASISHSVPTIIR